MDEPHRDSVSARAGTRSVSHTDGHRRLCRTRGLHLGLGRSRRNRKVSRDSTDGTKERQLAEAHRGPTQRESQDDSGAQAVSSFVTTPETFPSSFFSKAGRTLCRSRSEGFAVGGAFVAACLLRQNRRVGQLLWRRKLHEARMHRNPILRPLLGTVFCNKNVKHVFSLCVDSLGNDYTSQYTPSLMGDDCTHCGEKICTALGDNLPLAQEQAHRLFGLAFFGGADSVRVNLRKDETLSLSIECGGREAGVVVGSVVELRVGMTGTRTGNRMLLLRTESVSTTHRCRFRIIECKQSTLSTVTMVSVIQFRCYGHAVNAIPRNDDSQYFGKAYTYYCETHTRMIHPCKQCRERALLTEKAMDDPSVIEEGDGAIPEDFASYMCDHHLRELGRMMCGRGGSSFGHRNLVPKSVRKQAEMAFQHKRRSPVTFAPEAVSPSKWHAASFPADDSITIAGLESASAAAAASDIMVPPDFGADFGFDEEEDVVKLFCSD